MYFWPTLRSKPLCRYDKKTSDGERWRAFENSGVPSDANREKENEPHGKLRNRNANSSELRGSAVRVELG